MEKEPKPRFKCQTDGCKKFCRTKWCRIDECFEAGSGGLCGKCLKTRGFFRCLTCGNASGVDRFCHECYGKGILKSEMLRGFWRND